MKSALDTLFGLCSKHCFLNGEYSPVNDRASSEDVGESGIGNAVAGSNGVANGDKPGTACGNIGLEEHERVLQVY